jgi:formylglycine-generating enzyme
VPVLSRWRPTTSIVPAPVNTPPGPAPFPDMLWIPGGVFRMGSDFHYLEERPAHRVSVDGFWMDRHPVTNAEFARFTAATGYVTAAEVPPDPATEPGVPAGTLSAGSLVFVRPTGPIDRHSSRTWWRFARDAMWRRPEGAGSSVAGLHNHPVVHVTLADAEAYARWAGKSLPTEAEWERAARGGLDGAEYAWGDELLPGGRHMANIWQGEFPWQNLCDDGFERTSPVGYFPSNGYGLFDMIGNVWEWTTDWYAGLHDEAAQKLDYVPHNPLGGARESSVDPDRTDRLIPRKVLKGGSFLSAKNSSQRYRPAARFPRCIDTATSDTGFRCVARISATEP